MPKLSAPSVVEVPKRPKGPKRTRFSVEEADNGYLVEVRKDDDGPEYTPPTKAVATTLADVSALLEKAYGKDSGGDKAKAGDAPKGS
jgi:hypothetical protein